jgi:hypothetical protein
VVRLKGGCPAVFSRVGSEMAALAAAGGAGLNLLHCMGWQGWLRLLAMASMHPAGISCTGCAALPVRGTNLGLW